MTTYVLIHSLIFSLSIVFDQQEERKSKFSPNSCSNIIAIYNIAMLL